MARRLFRIVAVLPLDNDHGQGILRGLGQFARVHPDLHVVKFSKTEPLTAGFLRPLNADGVIAKISSPEEETLLRRLRLPVVNISGELATPRVPTVNTDDLLVGRLTAQYFQRRAFRHFAYCGNETHRASQLRREGLAAEARRLGLSSHHYLFPREHEHSLRPARFRRALAAWLRRLPRPVAVLGFNDLVANEIVASCARAGLRVPEDVAVLGVGNDPTRLGFSTVETSSIELDTRRIGYRAAEILHARLTRGIAPPAEELVPPLKFVTRLSTDRFAVDDDAVTRALVHIRQSLGNTLYVAEIARAAGCSPRTLAARFRRALGVSIYAEVQRLRMERALELLAHPEMSIGEIAYATGHEDARHFGLAFKREFGLPPARYRSRPASRPRG